MKRRPMFFFCHCFWGWHCVVVLYQRKFGLKYSLMYCHAPIREANLGLVGEEAVGSQAAA